MLEAFPVKGKALCRGSHGASVNKSSPEEKSSTQIRNPQEIMPENFM